MALSFDWLLQPLDPAEFFATYYERQPLLIPGCDPARFNSLLSIAAIDRFLATTSPRYPDVFLVDAARKLSAEDYSDPDADDVLLLPRVYDLYRAGATIALRRLHSGIPELAALCHAMEKAFSSHFQANVYLSPPNVQGFGTHFDSHDVFVLQVAGSKIWTLNDTAIELPLHTQRFEKDKHIAGPATRELTLHAGDVFYCPRGLFHSARSTDEPSLHITLGLMAKTWADVMIEAVSEACLVSPAFRSNLPADFAHQNFDPTKAKATFRALVDQFARGAELEPTFKRLVEDFVVSRRPDLSGGLQEAGGAAIGPGTAAQARPDLIYSLREDGDGGLALLFGSTRLTFPASVRAALEHALAGGPFVVRDLPGRLDNDGKVVLVRRLINEGLLVRIAAPRRKQRSGAAKRGRRGK